MKLPVVGVLAMDEMELAYGEKGEGGAFPNCDAGDSGGVTIS